MTDFVNYEPKGRPAQAGVRARHLLSVFFVYVLGSQSDGRLYIGYTADVTQRLGQHNQGIAKSTKNRGPWELVHQE